MKNSEQPLEKTVISGSFRKYMEKIGTAVDRFHDAGIKVLAPATQETVNPGEEFVILTTDDPDTAPHHLEMNYMRNIRDADFLYVANMDGYVGQSAGTKMAYAALKGLPIVTAEEVTSFSEDISPEAQKVLKKVVSAQMALDDISSKRIGEVKREVLHRRLILRTGREQFYTVWCAS